MAFNRVGSELFTGSSVIGTLGQPIRVYSMSVLSGATEAVVKLYNGFSPGTLTIQETCAVASTGNFFGYGDEGILFSNGCSLVTDANTTSVLISYELVGDSKSLLSGTIEELELLNQLTCAKIYDTLPTGIVTATDLNLDYSIGTKTATFTWDSTSSARTYVDDDGILQLANTSNTGRIQGGYYDSTGFHAQKGLMVEREITNLLVRTDGTASGSGIWTGWTQAHSCNTAPTIVNNDASAITSISSAKTQSWTFVSNAADSNEYALIQSTVTGAGTVVNGDSVTFSCLIKTSGVTGATCSAQIVENDSGNRTVRTPTTNTIYSTGTAASDWKKYTYTLVASDKVATIATISGGAGGGTVTVDTTAAHTLSNNEIIYITGTTNFNGGPYTITVSDADTFTYSAVNANADEHAGSATQKVDNVQVKVGFNSGVDAGDSLNFEFYAPQLEVNPYPTSFIPTTTAAVTRNAESLSYLSSGNRTAASESIFIKSASSHTFAADGLAKTFIDTLETATGNRRLINSGSAEDTIGVSPNTGTAGCKQNTTTVPSANTSYVLSATMSETGDPNLAVYVDGTSEATDNDDFASIVFDENFYLGVNNAGTSQLDGIIQSVAIFSGVKSASEVVSITDILSS